MTKTNLEKLKQEMMMEEAISSAELAMPATNLEIEEVNRKWNCHQIGCDFNRKRIYGSNVCDMNCKNVFDGVLSSMLQQRMDEIEELVREARSDDAPFNRDPIEHANNLILQKNEILNKVLNIIKSVDKNKE